MLCPSQAHEMNIYVLAIDGEPWFVGKDVAVALGYANASDAISTHCKGVAKRSPLQTGGGTDRHVTSIERGCKLGDAGLLHLGGGDAAGADVQLAGRVGLANLLQICRRFLVGALALCHVRQLRRYCCTLALGQMAAVQVEADDEADHIGTFKRTHLVVRAHKRARARRTRAGCRSGYASAAPAPRAAVIGATVRNRRPAQIASERREFIGLEPTPAASDMLEDRGGLNLAQVLHYGHARL